jgi:hypothetical protein
MQKDWMLLHVEAQGLLLCTDLRDNTIALTTFQEFHRAIPSSAYSENVGDLYEASTSAMISASRSLDVFAGVSGGPHTRERQADGMPTWVPDWSRERGNIPLYWSLDCDTPFKAADGYAHSPDSPDELLINGCKVLVVKGRVIGRVRHVVGHEFESFGDESSPDEFFNLRDFVQSWRDFMAKNTELQEQNHSGPSSIMSEAAASRALMSAMTASFGSQSSFTADNIRSGELSDILLNEMVYMAGCLDLVRGGMESLVTSLAMTYGGPARATAKLRQWGGICLGRRIVFGDGQAMGLVSKNADAGDEICILHGSRVPIVLRRSGSGYEVIGQCYWHNWMYGDKVDWKEGEGDTFLLI